MKGQKSALKLLRTSFDISGPEEKSNHGKIMEKLIRGVLFVGFMLVGAGGRLLLAADGDKCTIAVKGDSPVVKACAQGGVKEAKAAMRELVKTAKANGAKFQCDGCHKDTDAKFELTADARDSFKKLLAAQKK